jgi:hypothetical protein
MWAPIAAVLLAFGAFSTPDAVESEKVWLAQHQAQETDQFQCADVDSAAQKADEPTTC